MKRPARRQLPGDQGVPVELEPFLEALAHVLVVDHLRRAGAAAPDSAVTPPPEKEKRAA